MGQTDGVWPDVVVTMSLLCNPRPGGQICMDLTHCIFHWKRRAVLKFHGVKCCPCKAPISWVSDARNCRHEVVVVFVGRTVLEIRLMYPRLAAAHLVLYGLALLLLDYHRRLTQQTNALGFNCHLTAKACKEMGKNRKTLCKGTLIPVGRVSSVSNFYYSHNFYSSWLTAICMFQPPADLHFWKCTKNDSVHFGLRSIFIDEIVSWLTSPQFHSVDSIFISQHIGKLLLSRLLNAQCSQNIRSPHSGLRMLQTFLFEMLHSFFLNQHGSFVEQFKLLANKLMWNKRVKKQLMNRTVTASAILDSIPYKVSAVETVNYWSTEHRNSSKFNLTQKIWMIDRFNCKILNTFVV